MKKKFSVVLVAFAAALMLGFTVTSCKSKPKDADIKTAVEQQLNNPAVSVAVTEGAVTLTGEVIDDAAKAALATSAQTVKGVKSVDNQLTVTPPPAPVVISADDSLATAVNDAIKDHAGVTAAVKDGVVTLTGEVKKADLAKLMQKVNALKPRKVENKTVSK